MANEIWAIMATHSLKTASQALTLALCSHRDLEAKLESATQRAATLQTALSQVLESRRTALQAEQHLTQQIKQAQTALDGRPT